MNHSFPRIPCSPGKDKVIESCENCGQKRIRYRKGGVCFLDVDGTPTTSRPYPCSSQAVKRYILAQQINQLVQFYEKK